MSQRPDDPDNSRIKKAVWESVAEAVNQKEVGLLEALFQEEQVINSALRSAGYPKGTRSRDGGTSPSSAWFYLLTSVMLMVLLFNGFLVYQSLEQTKQMQTVIEQIDR